MINTTRKHYEGFTRSGIKRADAEYKALGCLGNPTVDDFEKIGRSNQIQNCPITSKDTTNAKVIFGNHLSGIRVMTVRCTPKRVDSYHVVIQREFQLFHKSVTFVANVFSVNGIPFFIKISRNLCFVTVENMQSRTTNQLSK